jgi:hypothetical protein
MWLAAEDVRQALEAEKKKVEGGLSFACLLAGCFVFLGSASNFSSLVRGFQAYVNSMTQAQVVQTAYNSSQ